MAKKPSSDNPFASLAGLSDSLKAAQEEAKALEREKAKRLRQGRQADSGFAGIEAELMRHAEMQEAEADSAKAPTRMQKPSAKPAVKTRTPAKILVSERKEEPSSSKQWDAGNHEAGQTQVDPLHSPGSPVAGRGVKAILGPTNTGKTHHAIERMVSHGTGIIGLPLRLLAREVYTKLIKKVGKEKVALHTGEERIVPDRARYHVCTVEAMPAKVDVDFVAIDEIQLAADFERGHVFTDRLLHLRGREETLLLGAATMEPLVRQLLPKAEITSRPRMSMLTYEGSKKLSRLSRRSAVVTFSVNDVYAIAELVRRQKGGAAVVMGSLSPRTRNAQVELFQNGDVDHLIATDAIGMGLNLDLDHVAFAAEKKFDGFQHRRLTAAELAQIAGRAGRHTRDGTFGVTGRVDPFEEELVEQLECHVFQPLKILQWRNRDLDFSSYRDLIATLEEVPNRPGLTKALPASDIQALELLYKNHEIKDRAENAQSLRLLWEVCQIPDYRKIAPANHAELIGMIFEQLDDWGTLSRDWLSSQIAYADRTDGDIDTLANRIAHIRTWTFVANKKGWLDDPLLWQDKTRAVEDRLSDALHERLTKRFIDRRTSVLMKRLREKTMLEAEITPTGDVLVEGQHVGQLQGFRFAPDVSAEGNDAKAIHAAAQKVLSVEFESRSEKIAGAANDQFLLSGDGLLRWQGAPIAKLTEGAETLKPRLTVLADEGLTGAALENVQMRINLWLTNHINQLLQPLVDLANTAELEGIAKGVAFRLVENLGILDRRLVAEEVRSLDQDARASLRKFGVRFGAYHIYVPALLKPAPSTMLVMLWALRNGGLEQNGLVEVPALSASGRTSIPVDETIKPELYKTVGFGVYGKRAVRIDILERLADLIRPLLSWRPTEDSPEPPEGVMDRGFTVTVAMTSLLGCAGEDFSAILKALGYRVERRKIEAEAVVVEEAKASEENVEANEAEGEAKPDAKEQPKDDGAEAQTEDVASAATETSGEAGETAEEPEEKWLEIWRPGGRGGKGGQRLGPRNRGGQRDGKAGHGGNRSGGRHDGGRKNHARADQKGRGKPRGDKPPRREEKKADPDSPFAALAALKANMGKDK